MPAGIKYGDRGERITAMPAGIKYEDRGCGDGRECEARSGGINQKKSDACRNKLES